MKSKEWDVNGLPPVGAECEYYCSERGKWRKCEVVAYYFANVVAIDVYDSSAVLMQSMMFRPIKTPEQIIDEERQHAIDEMYSVIRESQIKTVAALYDAGYRKTEVKK